MRIQAYFEDIQEHIIAELETAESSILIAVAWFTDNEIFETLCKLASKGIRVEIVMNNDRINARSGLNYDKLEELGGKVIRVGGRGKRQYDAPLMHNKFCIIDDETIITGSYNWTNKAQSNHENINITRNDPKFAQQYIQEFNAICKGLDIQTLDKGQQLITRGSKGNKKGFKSDDIITGSVKASELLSDYWPQIVGLQGLDVAMDIDSSGNWLVTASGSQVYIWSLLSKKCVKTFYLPCEDSADDLTVAMSPDSSFISCGGKLSYSNCDSAVNVIYILDIKLMQIVNILQLDKYYHVIKITYSKDGNYLIVQVHDIDESCYFRLIIIDSTTLKTIDTKKIDGAFHNMGLVAEGKYIFATGLDNGKCYYIEITNDGVIGKVECLDLPVDSYTSSQSISADGNKIALKYHDNIVVYNATGYNSEIIRFTPSDDIESEKTTWSYDSRFIYEVGEINKCEYSIIIRKHDLYTGVSADFHTNITSVAKLNYINQLIALPKGGLVYASCDVIGLMTNNGRCQVLWEKPTNKVLREGDFLCSDDGYTVHYSSANKYDSAIKFDLKDRYVEWFADGAYDDLLYPPVTGVDGCTLCCSDGKLYLNDVKLNIIYSSESSEIAFHEASKLLIISQHENLVGFWERIICFDLTGKILWRTETSAGVTRLNISENGMLGIAALNDGTTIWFRMNDGNIILTLFIHSDNSRWIVWTQSGYYDSSEGGDELIGWQVNKSAFEEADFYTASLFKADYKRPEIIDSILDTIDEQEAISLANS